MRLCDDGYWKTNSHHWKGEKSEDIWRFLNICSHTIWQTGGDPLLPVQVRGWRRWPQSQSDRSNISSTWLLPHSTQVWLSVYRPGTWMLQRMLQRSGVKWSKEKHWDIGDLRDLQKEKNIELNNNSSEFWRFFHIFNENTYRGVKGGSWWGAVEFSWEMIWLSHTSRFGVYLEFIWFSVSSQPAIRASVVLAMA